VAVLPAVVLMWSVEVAQIIGRLLLLRCWHRRRQLVSVIIRRCC